MRIVIVDADPEARGALRRILGEGAGVIREYDNICDAVRGLMREEFDMMVLDPDQPGVACETTLSILRQVAPQMSVVLTTADPAGRNAARGAQAGALRIIGKPWDTAEILEAVHGAGPGRREPPAPPLPHA